MMPTPSGNKPHIFLAQMEVVPGHPARNLETALRLLHEAKAAHADVVVFPELCLSGYLVGDFWEERAFVDDCLAAGARLVAASDGCTLVFGNIARDDSAIGEDGRSRLYNACYMASNGVLVPDVHSGLPFIPKTLLPNYREFEETRHFHDLRRLERERNAPRGSLYGVHDLAGLPLGIILCEDGWGDDYGENLVRALAEKGAQLVLDLSASPYTRRKNDKRNRVFSALARECRVPIAYVNCIGSQNNGKTFFGFDGCSTVYSADGAVVASAPAWAEVLLPVPENVFATCVDNCQHEVSGLAGEELKGSASSLASPWAGSDSEFEPADFFTLKEVLRRYLDGAGLRKVVIGVSGGIDSAVASALFAHVCGPSNVLLVSMPSQYNSATTRSLASQLALNLGCWFAEVPIGDSVDLTRAQIDGLVAQGPAGSTLALSLTPFHLENVQARDRSARVLSALASAFGGVFTCNANKAETTVGYSTLYGDHGGFMAPLADLWKSEIYALGAYLNAEVYQRPVIPAGIFSIKPSAELSTAQNPEQGGGDPILYAYHDCLFRAFQQRWNRIGPEEILEWYLQGTLQANLGLPAPVSRWFATPTDFVADLERWWKLFKGMGTVKRVQSPPIVALSRRAYGYDYRESILPGVWFSEAYSRRKQSLPSCHP